jgi:arylsulfatase
MGDIFSDAGYATAILGKWHIGDSAGRWPTDHGFDEWYGIPRSYDESLWPGDPWYDPKRDPVTRVLEGRKGEPVRDLEQLTVEVRRDIDVEYMKRAKAFLKRSTDAGRPFFLYFNHSMMHLPTIPRAEFKDGTGDWANSLLELDTDVGTLMDYLKELGVDDNTIVVFSGDNGPEEMEPWRGDGGPWVGSYFTGMEGSLRTPAIVRYPGHVPTGQVSNEIVHITDMFTTIVEWAGLDIPKDRVIDGVDQRAFFEGKQKNSNREGFLYWMNDTLYGVKWRNFKMVLVLQKTLSDPALHLATPHLVNLDVDPKERKPYDYPYIHSWVIAHTGKLLQEFKESVIAEPLIPVGAPLDYVPKKP